MLLEFKNFKQKGFNNGKNVDGKKMATNIKHGI